MLAVTENATTIVNEITKQQPEGVTALRITGTATPEPSFEVSAVAGPEPGDQTVEQGGATIYLDATAAEQLDDKILDAALDPDGGVQFALAPQA